MPWRVSILTPNIPKIYVEVYLNAEKTFIPDLPHPFLIPTPLSYWILDLFLNIFGPLQPQKKPSPQ
jgi:hypothetical protein